MISATHKITRFIPRFLIRGIFIVLLFFAATPDALLFGGNNSFERPQQKQGNPTEFVLKNTSRVCDEFFSPFNETDRKNLDMIEQRITGIYGEYRRSYKPGHRHAGLDLRGDFNEKVYALGFGWVVQIFRQFPHRSIVIEHHLSDGNILYSMYVHVEDIQVRVGDWIDANTHLARLFNEEELKRADFGTENHLHLEIRKTLADRGRASYASMSMSELNKACMDPLKFFKKHLK